MRIGFCGLGDMGLPIATRLIGAGHELAVWNRTRGAADRLRDHAQVVHAPAEAARRSDLVLTMLSDGDALESVVFGPDGIAEGLRNGSALIDLSTVGPDVARSVAARLPMGVSFLDAPVKGGPGRAAEGKLGLLVGAGQEAYARYSPLLSELGTVRHVGPVGSGAAAKVLNNYVVITLVSAMGEAFALADALGFDDEAALGVLSATPLRAVVERQWPRATGEAARSFKLRLAAKDLELGVDAADGSAGIGRVALERLRRAEGLGLGDEDQARVLVVIRGERGGG